MMEIIDFRVRPRTEFFLKGIVPKVLPAYEKYVELFHMEPRIKITSLAESVVEMTAASITHGVIFSPNASGNHTVHEACSQFQDHYYGLAGIDITEGVTRGVEDLERAYEELGLLGLCLSPFMTGVRPDDPRYYPLYALSDRKGKLLQIHSAVHFNPAVPLDIAHPKYIDRIAVDFPNLRIVMCHAGYGFGTLGLRIVQRHRNMFADFSGLHPRTIGHEYIAAINGFLNEKAIFGTNYPCLEFGIVKTWRKLFGDRTQQRFFCDNAKHALGIES